MGIEIVANILMLIFAGYCYWDVGHDIPPSPIKGAMNASMWPRGILVFLMIALVINIIAIYRANKASGTKKEIALKEFITPKFMLAVAILVAYALLLDVTGFLLTTFVFFMVFAFLIGLRKPGQLVLGGLVATVAMYLIFQISLQVMLPRGVGVFREMNIWLEVLWTKWTMMKG